jgi:beta-galactosidase
MRRTLLHSLPALVFVLGLSPAVWSTPAAGCPGVPIAQDAGHIRRIIAFTTLHSVKLEATFDALPAPGAAFGIKITDDGSGKTVFDQPVKATSVSGPANKMTFFVDGLTVDPWTPTSPKLYRLVLTEAGGNNPSWEETRRIGFRFFESREGNLYLNGKPVFLRGIAINPPDRGIPDSIEKSRKFAEEYVKFMKSIHVNIIRIPNNETWYDVCDEQGMMVFGGNYSGSVDGEKPPKDYDRAVEWYENKAFAMIAGHPCLMVYAMTNEVPFAGKVAEDWEKFLSYASGKLKQWDSTRAYIANAGYGYGKSGDICDLHRYWGWYYSSPFTFLHVRNNRDIIPFAKKTQPITFTECVGNYSGPDGRYNLTPDHKNPGSQLNWTGHAPDDVQALLANEHQCFTFKQATELIRRLRIVNPELSGVFPFTILFYNWHTIKQFIDMGPKPVTEQAKLSYSPVLVSWENWTTQLYTGTTMRPVVHIVNDADDFTDLVNPVFVYQLLDDTKAVVFSDSIALPTIKYYASYRKEVAVAIPPDLPIGHYQLAGRVMEGGKLISENFDGLFIAGKAYVTSVNKPGRRILLYETGQQTAASLDKLSIPFRRIRSFAGISPADAVIIGENSADTVLVQQASAVRQFVKGGGRLLCLRQDGGHLPRLNAVLDSKLKNITMDLDISRYPPPARPSRNGYYVNPERPDHPVFYGIDRENLKVWSDYTHWNESEKNGFPAIYPVTDGFVPVDKKEMRYISVLGDYGPGLEGMALAEIFSGKGSVLVCGLDLAGRSGIDPVADRMLANLVDYSGNDYPHDPYILVTAPIIWGDYKSEKGILTGINSGLLLNSKPRLTGSYSNEHITISREGYEFAGQKSGFNTRPGVQYVAYGRRPFGPYSFRGFGDVPKEDDPEDNEGEGSFYCRVPRGKTNASTLVWNPSDTVLSLKIDVNGRAVTRQLKAGEKTTVDCPVGATTVKMTFTGDRRLVLLQTTFNSGVKQLKSIADVKLPAIFSDQMVLQQKTGATIWGWAGPGEKVTVAASWSKETVSARADAAGRWQLILKTPAAGGPYTLQITGNNRIELKDVMIGEVWVCSGQSNMVFSLKSNYKATEEIQNADFPSIRYFSVSRQYGPKPFADCPGSVWQKTAPGTAGSFSAVAYFFARKLQHDLHTPVGIIYSAWGGTPAEAWTPPGVIKNDPALHVYLDRWAKIQQDAGRDSAGYNEAMQQKSSNDPEPAMSQSLYYYKRPWREPGVLFDGMIYPVIPYKVKGILWYQGESNVSYAGEYAHLFGAMIQSWRDLWNADHSQPGLPFYFVQIAPFGYSDLDAAARLREAQYQVTEDLPQTGMAVTIDLGNMKDIHYTHKKEVGDRLALIALSKTYGRKDTVYSGPLCRQADGEQGKVQLTFDQQLQTVNGGGAAGFEIGYKAPGSDTLQFVRASSRLEGKRVIVWNNAVQKPLWVRYAWLLAGEANLAGGSGLPAEPFRMQIK